MIIMVVQLMPLMSRPAVGGDGLVLVQKPVKMLFQTLRAEGETRQDFNFLDLDNAC